MLDAGDTMQALSIVSLFVAVTLATFALLVGLADFASLVARLTVH